MNTQAKVKWISKWTFILAAVGSAVGLGNIWGFPYKAGTEGGGAFVLIYLGCIVLVGLPIMMAEIIIGKRYRMSPVGSMKMAASESNVSSKWQLIGWGGLVAGIFILSFYSVLAGICIHYIGIAFNPVEGIDSAEQFDLVTKSPSNLLLWHSLFMILTASIIAAGVINGIERIVKILMPALFIIMMIMVINSSIVGNFIEGIKYLFVPDFSKIDSNTILVAMGQAFFSLSLGMGAIMCYGAYIADDQNIFKTSLTVAGLDTLIAILAGLVIFPLVLATGLEAEGPGLVFVTLLTEFTSMPYGEVIGSLFFLLLTIAALSSAISLLEPSVAYMEQNRILSRPIAAMILGMVAWILGIGSALSFNLWEEYKFLGDKNFFDSVVFIGNELMLPLGGMLVAFFVGWKLKPLIAAEMLEDSSNIIFRIWIIFIRFISPILIALIFVNVIYGFFNPPPPSA
tara:strand:+ start:342 stop:1706 length:1365 start_codon:yes stop_codon:yes gene_type:complete